MAQNLEMNGMGRFTVHLTNPYCPWSTAGVPSVDGRTCVEVWARGSGWDGDRYLEGQQLADWLCQRLGEDGSSERAVFAEALATLRGFFALVVRTRGYLLAAVDHQRSIPLFYGTKGTDLMLADDARSVRAFVGDWRIDDVAAKEFLLTAFVTGEDTLCPSVKQIQAGTYIWCQAIRLADIHVQTYYRFMLDESAVTCAEELYPLAQTVYQDVFHRLVRGAQGRQIVVPLSGGIDSRSVAAMLKLVGAKDVLCFSYGVPGNWEAVISQKVAAKLGYPWHFVPYTRRLWREGYRTRAGHEYASYAGNLVSIPHMQDWLAVREMKREGRISPGALFVPGHTTTRSLSSRPRVPGHEEVVSRILARYYRYWRWSARYDELAPLFGRKLRSAIADDAADSISETVGAFETWGFQDLFPKLYVNSVRVYEFWGFDWSLPLFDRQMMDLYAHIPLELRIGKGFFKSYLEDRVFGPLGIGGLHPPAGRRGPRAKLDRITNPYLGAYSPADMLRSWRLHTRAFGGHARSLSLLLSINSIATSAMLHLWEAERP